MEGAIMPAVRQYYRKNPDFKAFIDNIRPQVIHAAIDKICADAKKHTGDNLDGNSLKSLFGEDFCVFLQNFIQPPAFWSNECTPDFVEGLYKKHGFSEITRLNEYVRRNDVRKLFAPLHYDRNYSLSKILYGEGYVKYIAKKI